MERVKNARGLVTRQLKLNIGVMAVDPAQKRGEVNEMFGDAERQAQGSYQPPAMRSRLSFKCLAGGESLPRAPFKYCSDVSQADAAVQSFEELQIVFGFQRGDVGADSGWRQRQFSRRAGDTGLLGDGDESSQMEQFHIVPSAISNAPCEVSAVLKGELLCRIKVDVYAGGIKAMRVKYKSQVGSVRASADAQALAHFAGKLRFETDPADVFVDTKNGVDSFVILDVRSAEDYVEKHIPGAVSLPHSRITEKRMREYADDTLFVVYCWGPGCNGSTKAALKLTQLGYAVKEMIGGIEYWEREGYTVVSGR